VDHYEHAPTERYDRIPPGWSVVRRRVLLHRGWFVHDGQQGGTTGGTLERTTWAVQATPHLGGPGGQGFFSGVSCPGVTACTVVGTQILGGHFGVLAEHWNGTRFTVDATVPAPNSQASDLEAVSCTTSRACTAVGTNTLRRPEDFVPLAEQES
jgi:hypothetical protein